MADSQGDVMSIDQFVIAFCEFFSRDAATVDRTSRLVDDLAFDSIEYAELLILLDEIAGYTVPEEMLEALASVDDVYIAYCNYSAHS
jgi:acyl carrier protein